MAVAGAGAGSRSTSPGYVGEGQAQTRRCCCPVAPRAEALALLARVLPGVDVDAVPLYRRTGVGRCGCDPIGWRSLGVGADDRVLVTRTGRFTRVTDVVLHEKLQSVRMRQGPLQRRLGLASVHLDTTPGPVNAERGAPAGAPRPGPWWTPRWSGPGCRGRWPAPIAG